MYRIFHIPTAKYVVTRMNWYTGIFTINLESYSDCMGLLRRANSVFEYSGYIHLSPKIPLSSRAGIRLYEFEIVEGADV